MFQIDDEAWFIHDNRPQMLHVTGTLKQPLTGDGYEIRVQLSDHSIKPIGEIFKSSAGLVNHFNQLVREVNGANSDYRQTH